MASRCLQAAKPVNRIATDGAHSTNCTSGPCRPDQQSATERFSTGFLNRMPYLDLLKRSLRLTLRPGLWPPALLMALDVVWQFSLNTAFIYGGMIVLLREVAGDQLPPWLTGTAMFGLCFGVGLTGLVVSTFGEAVLLPAINENSQISNAIRSGWPRYGALLIVRLIMSLPALILSGIAAAGLMTSFTAILQRRLSVEQLSLALLGAATFISLIGTAVIILAQGVAVGAERAAVLERLNAVAALRLGWHLLWRKLSDYVVIGVLLLFVSLIISALLSCAGGVLLGGWFNALLRDGTLTAIDPAGWVSLLSVGWLVVALGYLLTTGVWTFAYQQWRNE